MRRSHLLLFIILGCSCLISTLTFAASIDPNQISITIQTKNIQGAIAHLESVIRAPSHKVWKAFINFNQHKGTYPRIVESSCITQSGVQKVKNLQHKKPSLIKKIAQEYRCNPYTLRKENWSMFLYQVIDYPFPLSDRWILSTMRNQEKIKTGIYQQKGHLVLSNQKLHQFDFLMKPDPNNPQWTHLKARFHSDPGGIIMGWMVKLATKQVLPKFVRTLEKEALK